MWADVVIGPYRRGVRNTVGRNVAPIGLLPDGERIIGNLSLDAVGADSKTRP